MPQYARRDPDRAAGVGAERVGRRRLPRRARPSRCSTRPDVRLSVARVERHPEGGVDAAGRVLEQVRLAEELGARGPQARDDRRVPRRRRRHRRPSTRSSSRRRATSMLSFTATGTPCSGPSTARLGRRQLGDHRVQRAARAPAGARTRRAARGSPPRRCGRRPRSRGSARAFARSSGPSMSSRIAVSAFRLRTARSR